MAGAVVVTRVRRVADLAGSTTRWALTYHCGHDVVTDRAGASPRVGDRESCTRCEAGEAAGASVLDAVTATFQRHLDAAARIGDVLTYSGIRVRIDRPVGFVQTGTGPDGIPWARTYTVPYGEILGTSGGDGEALDVFCGPNPDAPLVFWAEQKKRDGTFDEFKLGLGWPDHDSFVSAYLAHIPADRLGRIGVQPISQVQALRGLDPGARAAALAVLRDHGPSHRFDLGQGDVHVPGPVKVVRSACVNCGSTKGWYRQRGSPCVACGRPFFAEAAAHTATDTTGIPMATNVPMISTQKRKSLPADKFALPDQRKYPIDTKARVRNAPARLEAAKNEGKVSPADYSVARKAIARAAKKFGIKSEYLETDKAPPRTGSPLGRRPGVHVRVEHPDGHRVEIHHNARQPEGAVAMSDRAERGDGLLIDLSPLREAEKQARIFEAQAQAIDATDEAQAEKRTKLLTDATRLREDAYAPKWNQLAKVGQFRGHSAGPFELTPTTFEEICRNYAAIDHGEVPVDFEHASEAAETDGSIPQAGAPAQGWIKQLDNRNAGGLWGLIAWGDLARQYILDGKYRFLSPAIRFGARHPETAQPIGARLTSVALTNRPFLRQMQPLAARDKGAPGATTTMSINADPAQMLKSLKACMKLPELATHKMMKDHLDMLREHVKTAGIGAAPHGHAMGVHCDDVHLGDYIAPMAETMSVAQNCTVDDLLDAVEEMIDAAMARHVAEYHGMNDATPTDPAALAVQLGETKAQLAAKTTEVRTVLARETALKNEKAALTLELTARDATITDLKAQLTAKDADLTKLRDAETARAEQAITARVAEAFDTYKDAQNLTEDHRDMMTLTLRSDAAKFEKLFPVVPPDKRHMLRNVTGGRMPTQQTAPHQMGDRQPGAQPQPVGAPGRSPGQPVLTPQQMNQLANRLMSDKRMDAASANTLAYKVAQGAEAYPFPS